MNRVGLVIDMSHSAERSTLEAIEQSSRPIAITHANPALVARRTSQQIGRGDQGADTKRRHDRLFPLPAPFGGRDGLHLGKLLRDDRRSRLALWRQIARYRIGPLSGSARQRRNLDAQWPLDEGNGLWRGVSIGRRVPATAKLV